MEDRPHSPLSNDSDFRGNEVPKATGGVVAAKTMLQRLAVAQPRIISYRDAGESESSFKGQKENGQDEC